MNSSASMLGLLGGRYLRDSLCTSTLVVPWLNSGKHCGGFSQGAVWFERGAWRLGNVSWATLLDEMLRPLGIKWKDLRRRVSQCGGRCQNVTHVRVVHSPDYSTGHTNGAFELFILKFRSWHVLFFHLPISPVTPLHGFHPAETST